MNNNCSIKQSNSVFYSTEDIKNRSLKRCRTHSNKLTAIIYKICKIVSEPLRCGIHYALVHARSGEGYGKEWGPGGESKKFSLLKAAGFFSLTILTLPLVVLSAVGLSLLHPGRGKDYVQFMDATKTPELKNYIPPRVDDIHIATYNIAALPSPVDAIKDVISSSVRAEEFVKWINNQDKTDLPLFFGLQEVFDQNASEIITNGVSKTYPYAVTSAGWSEVPIIGSNSGIQLHSRVPIKSTAFFPFQDLKGLGVRASARGVLRVELDLGGGKSLMAYVTHTQPHSDKECMAIRKNEIKAIAQLMRRNRKKDLENGVDREGEYYLLGDLNVGNIDDETLEKTNEHKNLRQQTEVLNHNNFYDAYFDDHDSEGKRIKGSPIFLEKDTHNKDRKEKGMDEIKEDKGTFFVGADQKNRGKKGYGTTGFPEGPQKTLDDCLYDHVLRLGFSEDLGDKPLVTKKGHIEVRNVISEKLRRCPISDHKMLSAIFRPN